MNTRLNGQRSSDQCVPPGGHALIFCLAWFPLYRIEGQDAG